MMATKCAAAPSTTGASWTIAKLGSGPPSAGRPANRSDSGRWSWARTLTPKRHSWCSSEHIFVRRSTEMSTRGGSSDTDMKAFAVIPWICSETSVVTTVTPVANIPSVCRNATAGSSPSTSSACSPVGGSNAVSPMPSGPAPAQAAASARATSNSGGVADSLTPPLSSGALPRELRHHGEGQPLHGRRRGGHHGLVAVAEGEPGQPARAVEARRQVAGVVQALARGARALGQELLQAPAGDHLGSQPRFAAAVVGELVADVRCDDDRAVRRHEVAPRAVELQPDPALQRLPTLLERGVEVLGEAPAVLEPRVDPQVVSLALERVRDAVDRVVDAVGRLVGAGALVGGPGHADTPPRLVSVYATGSGYRPGSPPRARAGRRAA